MDDCHKFTGSLVEVFVCVFHVRKEHFVLDVSEFVERSVQILQRDRFRGRNIDVDNQHPFASGFLSSGLHGADQSNLVGVPFERDCILMKK